MRIFKFSFFQRIQVVMVLYFFLNSKNRAALAKIPILQMRRGLLISRMSWNSVCCELQITPPSFVKGDSSGRLFEALYPRVDGPADTRHFVEEVTEEAEMLISETCHFGDQFAEFWAQVSARRTRFKSSDSASAFFYIRNGLLYIRT